MKKDLEIHEEAEEFEAEVKELLISLVEDIFELILTISEDNSNKVFNTLHETKEDTLRYVKSLIGGVVLSSGNYKRIAEIASRIAEITARIAKFSTKFIDVSVNVNIK